jgi:CarD family transcriptional regulator
MTLSVPVARAADVGVRPPVSPDELEDLVSVLSKADPRVPSNWSRRFKNHQEKLKSGDVYQVAEVVRNLALREATKGLSAGEKAMLVKARSVLVSELSFALNLSEDDALKKLEEQLT